MTWYFAIDGAQDPRLFDLVRHCAQHCCLISGKLDPDLVPVLPWLAAVDPQESLTQVWREHGRGRNWGIALESPLDLLHVKLHLKKFLNARLPDGQLVMFRFYDPRVFRTYLLAATDEERAPWFAGVSRFSVEAAQAGQLHDFVMRDGLLYDGLARVHGLST